MGCGVVFGGKKGSTETVSRNELRARETTGFLKQTMFPFFGFLFLKCQMTCWLGFFFFSRDQARKPLTERHGCSGLSKLKGVINLSVSEAQKKKKKERATNKCRVAGAAASTQLDGCNYDAQGVSW
jgi:hypothetical protein